MVCNVIDHDFMKTIVGHLTCVLSGVQIVLLDQTTNDLGEDLITIKCTN